MEIKEGNRVRLPPPPGVHRSPARPRKGGDDDDLWLVSYGDLITLLFCFFTLLLSVSKVDVGRMDQVKTGIEEKFKDSEHRTEGLAALQNQLRDVVNKSGLADDVRVRPSELGLVVDLNARILFPAGNAELSNKAMDLLDSLAGSLLRRPVDIQVEGHTDPIPIQSERFPSNWELSSSRATSVVRYLIDVHKFAPNRLRSVGLADTIPVDSSGVPMADPAPSHTWNEQYLARQRRVSLLLIPSASALAMAIKADGPKEKH